MRILPPAPVPSKGFHKSELDRSVKLIDQRCCVTLMLCDSNTTGVRG